MLKTLNGFIILLFLLPSVIFGQYNHDPFSIDDDDLNLGSDIFSDFSEDLDQANVVEDERFFRHGRFFSFQIAIGTTTFTGNRGSAYEDDLPAYGMGINYFQDFNNSFGLGFEFSKHHFFLDEAVNAYSDGEGGGVGLVDVSMLRVYFSYRYYIETTDLGTAITWSNPYLTGRLEYWYNTTKFYDRADLPDDSGGGLGLALGGGLEFPIKLKEYYVGVEALYHQVNFHDKYTQAYAPTKNGSGFGFDDMTGKVVTLMVSYVLNW